MAKRNLLLCFDAFGTLFRIKQPIERQYGDVAREQFGLLQDVSNSKLKTAFRTAFKAQSRAHPNYGRWTTGMGAAKWWTEVIEGTFKPFVPDGRIPGELAPTLLARFASKEGYAMDPRLPQLLGELKKTQGKTYDHIVVGVITNSDDRVPDIVSSFGLRVSPLRYGTSNTSASSASSSPYDVDFHCMSYDVGVEKPDPAIFRAAESLLPAVLGNNDTSADVDLTAWDKVYVGDEAAKDVAGAHAAGWNAALIQDDEAASTSITTKDGEKQFAIQRLADCPPQPLTNLFGPPSDAVVVGVDSAASFVEWLLRVDSNKQ